MLQFDFTTMMKARGITKLYAFLKQGGFSHRIASNLSTGQIRSFNLNYVERLCELFNCMPQDILSWEPTGSHLPAEHHPLAPLRNASLNATVYDDLHNMPLDELRQMTESWRAARASKG